MKPRPVRLRFRSNSKATAPSPSDIQTLVEDSDAEAAVEAASPTVKDLAAAGARIIERPDGTLSGRLEGAAAVRAAAEMMRPVHRLMAEDGLRRQAREREVTLRLPSGRQRVVHERQAEVVCKKLGARELGQRRRSSATTIYLLRNGVWWKRQGNHNHWVKDVVN